MIGIFITARLGSTRLKNKHLIEIGGKPMIKWLVDRFCLAFAREIKDGKIKIFITTSTSIENYLFSEIFENSIVEVFYGADSNIPLRHLECAKVNNIDFILSVDGDDILCSVEASRIVLEKLLENGSLVKTVGLPLGMNVLGYSTLFLEKSLKQSSYDKLETGWGKIFDSKEILTVEIERNSDIENIRMTLDYKEDVLFFNNVILGIGDQIYTISDKELIDEINKNKWSKLNENLMDEYWQNFNEQKKAEN